MEKKALTPLVALIVTLTVVATAGVNERGQVVGFSLTASGNRRAFIWQDGVMRDLGTLGGDFTESPVVNARGQVAGISATADGFFHGFVWEDGAMRDLGTLGG